MLSSLRCALVFFICTFICTVSATTLQSHRNDLPQKFIVGFQGQTQAGRVVHLALAEWNITATSFDVTTCHTSPGMSYFDAITLRNPSSHSSTAFSLFNISAPPMLLDPLLKSTEAIEMSAFEGFSGISKATVESFAASPSPGVYFLTSFASLSPFSALHREAVTAASSELITAQLWKVDTGEKRITKQANRACFASVGGSSVATRSFVVGNSVVVSVGTNMTYPVGVNVTYDIIFDIDSGSSRAVHRVPKQPGQHLPIRICVDANVTHPSFVSFNYIEQCIAVSTLSMATGVEGPPRCLQGVPFLTFANVACDFDGDVVHSVGIGNHTLGRRKSLAAALYSNRIGDGALVRFKDIELPSYFVDRFNLAYATTLVTG